MVSSRFPKNQSIENHGLVTLRPSAEVLVIGSRSSGKSSFVRAAVHESSDHAMEDVDGEAVQDDPESITRYPYGGFMHGGYPQNLKMDGFSKGKIASRNG